MKQIIKIFAISFMLLSIISCKKILDVKPEQDVDASQAIKTEQDVKALVIGGYSILAGGRLYGTNLLLLPDMLANEGYLSWRGTFSSFRSVANRTMIASNVEATRTWTGAYQAINIANIVLQNLDKVSDEETKNTFEGEALFIRGIMLFELVRLYGLPWGAVSGNTQPGVVIRTIPTLTEDEAFSKTPRSSVAEVYTKVITDLTAATQKLPKTNGTRASKYTAYAFLSRVYLQQGDYLKARDAANTVIESGLFKLNASVSAVFSNKNTAESIFEIQQNEQNNAGTSNDGMATFYASYPGIGRADVRMITSFLDTYDADDYRGSEWFYEGTGARPGNFYCAKWSSFSQNLPIIRIAEMYLTRAECNVRLGTTIGDTPENDLMNVRNLVRAGLEPISNPTLDDILNERFHELAFEGLRIHDLKRLHLPTGEYTWNDDILVFPIPQSEIDASLGVLKQNPGY